MHESCARRDIPRAPRCVAVNQKRGITWRQLVAYSRRSAFGALLAATATAAASPMIGPVLVDFILFAAVLVEVAGFNEHSLRVSLIGVVVISFYKIFIASFAAIGGGLSGYIGHLGHEWMLLTNLFFC